LAHDDLSQPYRQGSSNALYLIYYSCLIIFWIDGISERARAASSNSRNIQYNQDPRGAVNGNRSPYYNDPKHQNKLHQRDGVSESMCF
jgi:hypothetical protein